MLATLEHNDSQKNSRLCHEIRLQYPKPWRLEYHSNHPLLMDIEPSTLVNGHFCLSSLLQAFRKSLPIFS